MTRAKAPYQVDWSSGARRSLQRIPEKVATSAVEFIYETLAQEPHRVGRPLRLEFEGLHSARRGDHRIIYRIDAPNRRVVVEVIAHRADAYRRR